MTHAWKDTVEVLHYSSSLLYPEIKIHRWECKRCGLVIFANPQKGVDKIVDANNQGCPYLAIKEIMES